MIENEIEKRSVIRGQTVAAEKMLYAKQMRREMTRAEAALWERLRGRGCGDAKFRRQQPILGYIADFYCDKALLAVEVDGDCHDADYDAKRDADFARIGIRTLRFRNEQVLQTMETVLETIIVDLTPPAPLSSEERGESGGGDAALPAGGRSLSGAEPRGLSGAEPRGQRSIPASGLPPLLRGEGGGGGEVNRWDADHVMTTYARYGVTFTRGEGAYLFDAGGRRYLDLLSGIAVCSVGHCHPYLVRALQEQAATLLHVSNLFLTEPQARLARRLVELSDFERVFFTNSGAEANEAALKIARKYGRGIRESKTNIVTAKNSFHGRTIATVTAGGQPKYSAPFAPLPGGFEYVPFNDVAALESAVNDDTAAIMLEPIQGEGGIVPATVDYVRAARSLADKHGALLLFDEVQTGVGRTGSLWAYQKYGVVPDVMTLAKGIGGGVPIGVCLARGAAAETFKPGDHGSTFAGNPLATTAANAVLDILADEDLTGNARRVGAYLAGRLCELADRHPGTVGGVRGMGLMIGIGLHRPVAKAIVKRALLDFGLVINATGDDTIRLLPPLTLTETQANEGVVLIEKAIAAEEG